MDFEFNENGICTNPEKHIVYGGKKLTTTVVLAFHEGLWLSEYSILSATWGRSSGISESYTQGFTHRRLALSRALDGVITSLEAHIKNFLHYSKTEKTECSKAVDLLKIKRKELCGRWNRKDSDSLLGALCGV
jgi:hypothetical protein